MKDFGQQIVTNARVNRSKSELNASVSHANRVYGSLIGSLIDTFADSAIVADAALNFLSAGRDTTAQSLTWTFYLLMRHPPIVDRIRQEIALSFPAADQKLDPCFIQFADLQPNHLPYTMAVFYEALRLYPPVPFEIKQCEVDVTLPDGTFLPAGSIVVWCVWAMNRSKEIWGDQRSSLDSFDPSRWLQDGKLLTKSAFDFPVFNGGPRLCLGKKMAELMAAYVIGKLVREFNFVEIGNAKQQEKPRRSQNSLTLPMEGGLPSRVMLVQSDGEAG